MSETGRSSMQQSRLKHQIDQYRGDGMHFHTVQLSVHGRWRGRWALVITIVALMQRSSTLAGQSTSGKFCTDGIQPWCQHSDEHGGVSGAAHTKHHRRLP